jgi:hypothetical protein
MRHVRWARRIPAGRPIHIFGAGAGGLIVHDALRDAGVPVEGFVDDRVAGPVRDLPVRRLDAFAAGSGRTATVAIASRHWRTIARTLRAHAIADVVDASAIIWWSMPWPWFSGQRLGTLPALEAAMRAATGIGIEDLVGALGLSRAGNWGACAALLAAAGGDRDLPVFVEGTGAVAKDIRTFVNDLPGLHVVGHIEDGPPGFLDFLDRCSWDTFLADGPPDGALVVVTGDRGRALGPALRLLGITRIVVWEDRGEPPAVDIGGPWPPLAVDSAVTIVVDGADPALAASTVASVLDQTHPGVACLLHGVDPAAALDPHPRVRATAADLPRALAACGTPLAGHVAAGARLRPDAVATALARLVADPDLAGVVAAGPDGDAPATGIDLLDRLFGPPGADAPDGLFRRAALVEAGAAVAGSYELFCRLAFDMRLAALPLRAGAPAPPRRSGGPQGAGGQPRRPVHRGGPVRPLAPPRGAGPAVRPSARRPPGVGPSTVTAAPRPVHPARRRADPPTALVRRDPRHAWPGLRRSRPDRARARRARRRPGLRRRAARRPRLPVRAEAAGRHGP